MSIPTLLESSYGGVLLCDCAYFHFIICRFFRRGWITFDRSVNIKEICWDLNNIRVSGIPCHLQSQVQQCNYYNYT